MAWKKGKLHRLSGRYKTKGRWWYWNGNKRNRVWLAHPQKPSKSMIPRRR